MAFGNYAVLVDDFNRTDEDPLSDGGDWSIGPIGFTNALRVVSNEAAAEAGGSGSNSYRIDADYGPDVEVTAKRIVVTGGSIKYLFARLANVGAGTTDGYCVRIASSTSVSTRRIDDEVETILGAAETVAAINAGDWFGMEIIGSEIKFFHKPAAGAWTEKYARTDATYAAAGKVGLRTSTATERLDDFSAGTVVVVEVPPGMFDPELVPEAWF